MRLRRHRPNLTTAAPAEPHDPTGIDVPQVIREEFIRADATAAPTLNALCARRAVLEDVMLDDTHGSAQLLFDDGTTVTVAATGEPIQQVRAAARLVRTHLHLTTPCQDGVGRLLVFVGGPWTLYLTVDIALV